jgi:hypothetical protein
VVESNEDIRWWPGAAPDVAVDEDEDEGARMADRDCSAFSKARRMSWTDTHLRPPAAASSLPKASRNSLEAHDEETGGGWIPMAAVDEDDEE